MDPPMTAPDKKVLVREKKAYGRQMWQPLNETARLLCELGGWKNLTIEQLKIARKLGFEIERENPGIEGLEDD